jgi:hypothetical protein
MPNPLIQAQLELSLVESFIALARRDGYDLADPRLGDPNLGEPDCICADAKAPGGVVGFEVTAGYYNTDEAKDLREIVEGHPERSRRIAWPGEDPSLVARRLPRVLVNFDDALVAHLNAGMAKKAIKRYSTVRTYLLLDGRHAFLTTSNYAQPVLAELRPPLGHPFQSIFLALPRNWPGPGRDPIEWFRVGG